MSKSIGQLAKTLGVSPHTLRYYEKIRLLPPVSKTSSGRRLYDDKAEERIRFIKRAQRVGFSLDEIKQLINLDQSPDYPKPDVRAMVSEKVEEVELQMIELKALRTQLKELLNACEKSNEGERCPILEEFKHVTDK